MRRKSVKASTINTIRINYTRHRARAVIRSSQRVDLRGITPARIFAEAIFSILCDFRAIPVVGGKIDERRKWMGSRAIRKSIGHGSSRDAGGWSCEKTSRQRDGGIRPRANLPFIPGRFLFLVFPWRVLISGYASNFCSFLDCGCSQSIRSSFRSSSATRSGQINI